VALYVNAFLGLCIAAGCRVRSLLLPKVKLSKAQQETAAVHCGLELIETKMPTVNSKIRLIRVDLVTRVKGDFGFSKLLKVTVVI
jgi:hypothetical protein